MGIKFIPIAVETFGGWCVDAINTIKMIGHQLEQRMGSSPTDVTSHLFQRLAVNFWKGTPPCGSPELLIFIPKLAA